MIHHGPVMGRAQAVCVRRASWFPGGRGYAGRASGELDNGGECTLRMPWGMRRVVPVARVGGARASWHGSHDVVYMRIRERG